MVRFLDFVKKFNLIHDNERLVEYGKYMGTAAF